MGELARLDTAAIAEVTGATPAFVVAVLSTVAKGATHEQALAFLSQCQRTGLDPFLRQIYYVPTRSGASIIVGIDGLRSIAARTGNYRPGDTRYEYDENGNLVAAHVTVWLHSHDEWHAVTETAYLAEYRQDSPLWRNKPRVMLAKCAEARGLRRAFPAEMGGLYDADELPPADEGGSITEAPRPAQPAPARKVAGKAAGSTGDLATVIARLERVEARYAELFGEARLEELRAAYHVDEKVEAGNREELIEYGKRLRADIDEAAAAAASDEPLEGEVVPHE